MSISSQLPQIVTAARSGALQALALQAGQMLEGKVIGPAPNGGTQVQISGQMLNLILPTLAKAGETLKFEVQGNGTQLRLALQPATLPPTALPTSNIPPAPSQPATLPLPQVGVPAQAPAQTIAQPTVSTQPAAPQGQQVIPTSPAPQAAPPVVFPPPAPAATTPTPPTAAAATVPATAPVTAPLPQTAQAAPNVATGPPVAVTPPSASVSPQAPTQPYPQAPPAAANVIPQQMAPVTATASVPTGQTPATSALPPAQVPSPAPAAPMPATPQAALAQMVQASVPRQGSVTNLTSALTSIAGEVVLPEPVARAAQQVLAGRLTIAAGKIDAGSLQKAVLNSGVFQEAALVRGTTTPLQPDMKSSLLALRQTLTTWLGAQAPVTPPSQIAPPLRGAIPRARASDAPPIDPEAAPEEVGKHLLERTDSALSRLRLHQSASLPDGAAKAGTDWSMDLPVLIGTHQTLMQLQIHRDQQGNAEDATERGWQMRFAINLPGLGEVGAQVSLRGAAAGIMLWASERAASEALEAEMASLRETLSAAGLKPGAIVVRHGEPPTPPPAPSGHFVDART